MTFKLNSSLKDLNNTIVNQSFNTKVEKCEFKSNIVDELIDKGIIDKKDKLKPDILNSKLEEYLVNHLYSGHNEAFFQLGQLFFDKEDYQESIFYFKGGVDKIGDFQCMFQLGVIYYDGLGVVADPALGCAYMKRIFDSRGNRLVSHLLNSAAYNLGRASYQGYGIKQSDSEAEKYWLLAADDGNPQGSVMAQTALGFFYSTKEHLDLKKAFFWHSEACGNGSIESQACLGVLYLHGIGVDVNWGAALICLDNAAERGSIYAKGNLCYYFYKRKLFTKAADLSSQVVQVTEEEIITLSKHSSIIIEEYLRKGISIACFIFARCLHLGLGVQMDCEEAFKYYSKSYQWDSELCSDFQKLVQTNLL